MADEKKIKIQLGYGGSKGWLIFWAIIFFPVAFALYLTAASWEAGGQTYQVSYEGSRFWLGFWTLCFFPVAIVLILMNGLTATVKSAGTQAAA